MTSTLPLRLLPSLLSGVVAVGLAAPSNAAEELRIGYVAPTTGIFAQVGKDMVDGFQMYLDDVKNDFGGAKVKFIVEDEQAKPDTAVTRAKKLILQDKVHMLVGGVIGAIIVFGLREYLSTLLPWWQYVLGAVYVLTILYLPTGLMGIPERIRQRRALTRNRADAKKLAPVTS